METLLLIVVFVIAVVIAAILGLLYLFFKSDLARKIIKFSAAGICVTFVVLYWLFQAWEENWYKAAIPSQIGISGAAFISGESGFREGCGAAAFYLTDTAVQKIEREGLDFFKSALHGRGYPKPEGLLTFEGREQLGKYNYYTYNVWQETPVPASWVSEGAWLGLTCVHGHSELLHQVVQLAKQPGSYYATKPEGELIVIPKLKLVILSYFG